MRVRKDALRDIVQNKLKELYNEHSLLKVEMAILKDKEVEIKKAYQKSLLQARKFISKAVMNQEVGITINSNLGYIALEMSLPKDMVSEDYRSIGNEIYVTQQKLNRVKSEISMAEQDSKLLYLSADEVINISRDDHHFERYL